MVVIHVSGTTGSGKSFIGLLMQRIYNDAKLHVVDLDNVFKTAIQKSREKDAEKKFSEIAASVREFVEDLRARYKNVLITGYSDVSVDGVVRYIELGADEKFFIELPAKDLIQQYRWRASQHVMHTRHEARALSDDELRKLIVKDRKVYKSFRPMTQPKIVQAIILQIGK